MKRIQLKTQLGYELTMTEFKAGTTPKSIVLISPATGVKQSYYRKFATFLQANNYTVYTFDFGGIGDSKKEHLKQFDTSAFNWGSNDLEAALQFCRHHHAEHPLTVVGHSIGGQLVGLAPSVNAINKLVLVGSQTGYWKFWTGLERFKMQLNWYLLIPVLTNSFGFFPGKKLGVMEDLPKSMALEWRKWCVSPNYLFDHIQENQLNYHKVSCNLYSYSVSDDNYAPKGAVDWITKKYLNAIITRRHITPKEIEQSKVGHFGFFREKVKESIWNMILEDIEKK